MTNRGVAVIGLRLFALYLLVHSLTALPRTYQLLKGGIDAADPLHGWLLAAAAMTPPLIGLLLWFGVGPITSRLLPRRTSLLQPEPRQPSVWYGPAFAAVGLLVTVDALPALLEVAAEAHRRWLALQDLGPELTTTLAAASLRLLLGLAALLGSHGFARLIVRLRTGGLDHALSP